MSYQQCFGVCVPHQTVQLDSLPSSQYMALKQCSLVTLSSIHHVTPCIRRQKPRKLVRTVLISKKKLVSWPCPGRQYTSRSCVTTTTRRSVPCLFVRVTWCCAGSRNRMARTSCPLLG